MKNVLKLAFLMALTIGLSATTQAQNGQNGKHGKGFNQNEQRGNGPHNQRGMCYGLDLTDEQQEKMDGLRTKHLQETQDFRNQLNEKHARLQTLRTAQTPNMNQINSELEAISEIKLKMSKVREKHLQEVRSLLTAEQRVIFDSRPRGAKHGQQHGQGRGHGRKGGKNCGW